MDGLLVVVVVVVIEVSSSRKSKSKQPKHIRGNRPEQYLSGAYRLRV